jgi:hypothetical protein
VVKRWPRPRRQEDGHGRRSLSLWVFATACRTDCGAPLGRGEGRVDEGFTEIDPPAVAEVFREPLRGTGVGSTAYSASVRHMPWRTTAIPLVQATIGS